MLRLYPCPTPTPAPAPALLPCPLPVHFLADASLAIPNPKNTRKTFVNNADAVALNLSPNPSPDPFPDPIPMPIPILIPVPQRLPLPSLAYTLPIASVKTKAQTQRAPARNDPCTCRVVELPAHLPTCPSALSLIPLEAEFIKLGVTFVVALCAAAAAASLALPAPANFPAHCSPRPF